MPYPTGNLLLTVDQRQTLDAYSRSRKGRADLARRARAILPLADGASYADVTAATSWSFATVAKSRTRFDADRLSR
jgi:hypothetical protein